MSDRVPELFAELKRADVPVPPPGRVTTRGRQLRRRARLKVSAAVVAVIAGIGLVVQLVSAPGGRGRPATNPSPTPTSPAPARTTPPAHTALPPAGSGELILGLNASGQFVMTRTGSGSPVVPVPGLPSGGPSRVATDPAGGWIVAYTVNPKAPYGSQATRLAEVAPNGRSYDFGPVFSGRNVTSVAVSPDGSRVAVALTPASGSATSGAGKAAIEVLPTPGHTGATRTWTIPAPSNWVNNLSWAPDGEQLTYAVGFQTGAGIDGYPVTLDTSAPGSVAPTHSGWPHVGKGAPTAAGRAACPPDVGAWLGTTGQFAALEECDKSGTEVLQPADASNGEKTGPAVTIPGAGPGCLAEALDSAPSGNPILISYCGVYLDNDGRMTKLPGGLTEAALAG